MKHLLLFAALLGTLHATAQVNYPYPVQYITITQQGQTARMAYMDVQPEKPAGKNILLLHGKNFNGFYWKDLIPFLTAKGYRVIVPDQIGWGRSDRPNWQYSFHTLAANTRQLLDSLGVQQTVVLGHSMGGMLATRFSLLFPGTVSQLILENPIGLEDYKTFVPDQPLDKLWAKEKAATYESIKKYQQTYYPVWKPEYEPLVQAQAADLKRADFDTAALVNAVTYQMIYTQPVCYEFSRIAVPTLLIIGQADRTVVGKDQLTGAAKQLYGQYPALGKLAQQKIKGSILKALPGIGHIPHVQSIDQFKQSLNGFLK